MLNAVRRTVVGVWAVFVMVGAVWGQNLPSDPALVTGKLDNGLEYVVRKHSLPAGRATMWIHMHTGSLNETDKQRGIAHYLEHMAFNGSEHFKPGTLVPFFESLGMTFGRDQNAFTDFDQTTFQLSLPDAKPETVAKGMSFLSDVVSGLSLLPSEIDAERQIILEERRRGLSGRQRTSDYVMEHMTPGSIFGFRDAIGTEATIKGVTEPDFKAYYGKWYGASNATLIVVADADPAEVVKAIHQEFDSAPKKAKPTPQDLTVKAYDKSFAIVASDPEIQSESVRIVRLEPARPATKTVPMFRDDLVAAMGSMAMNRRYGDKVAAGGTAYLGARVGMGNEAEAIYTAEMSAQAAPGKWKSALEEAAMELQRAKLYGFTDREMADARKEIISRSERSVETEATASAAQLVGRINGGITTGDTIMSPSQELDLVKQMLPSITTDEVSKRFAKEFDTSKVAYIAVLPAGPKVPSEAELLAIGTKAVSVKPEKEEEVAHATKLMEQLPKPGTVKEGADHAATGVWSGWLSNNVRVNYKFNDYRKNEVSVRVSLIGGELLETDDNKGITSAAQLAWSRSATKHLSSTDIRELMTGKKVNVGGGFGRGRGGRGGGGGGDSISLSISGSPDELETGFQLAYLLLTEPKIEEASFTQFKTSMKQRLEESLKTPQGIAMRLISSAPYPDGEARTRPMEAADVDHLTLASSQAWLDKLLAESPIEVTIVGDLPKEQALDLAAKYLGALPTRERVSADTYASLRSIKKPAGPRVFNKTVESPTDQAMVYSGFYGADDTNRDDVRALALAAEILSTRMNTEIREKDQLVYSIGAGSRPGSTYPGFGTFAASAPTDPTKVDALIAKLSEMYEEFAKNGPTDEEVDVAKKQMKVTFDEQMKEPGFWSGRLNQITFRGTSLDDIANDPAAYQALTAKQVHDTFVKYYSKENVIEVSVKPIGEKSAEE